jgi:hypothetical protein
MRIIARGDSPAYESVGWVFPRARLVSVNKHSRTQVFPLEWLLEVKQRRGPVWGPVSPGKVRHECRKETAPTLDFPLESGKLSEVRIHYEWFATRRSQVRSLYAPLTYENRGEFRGKSVGSGGRRVGCLGQHFPKPAQAGWPHRDVFRTTTSTMQERPAM